MENEITTRAAELKPSSLDENSRTVRIVAATDAPVTVRDWQRGTIPEILEVEKFSLPEGRERVPFLDSHNRSSSRAVVGTVFDLKAAKGKITGVAEISSAANDLFAKIREGHLTDVSVGYLVNDARYIEDGESETISGLTIQGPAKIVTDFMIKEISAVPIGADVNSIIRSENIMTYQNADPEQIRIDERNRCSEIRAMCERFELPEMAEDLIQKGTGVDAARAAVMERVIAQTPEPRHRGVITIERDAQDKRIDAAVDGKLLAGGVRVENPAAGAEEYRKMPLKEIARESLQSAGGNTRGMTTQEIVREAMGLSSRSISHTTSDFPNILGNVANKSSLLAYQQAPSTCRAFCRISTATDFKPINEVRLSEGPDLVENKEAEEIEYGTFEDEGVSYQVKRYARLFSVSDNAIYNDDLGLLLKVPQAYGMAAARLVNKTFWDLHINNTTLDDGVALYHSSHSNLVDSGAGPNETQLDSMRKLMRKQQAPQGANLNIQPRYLAVPASLETDAAALLTTVEGFSSSDGAGRRNPFYNALELIIEPYLDTSSEKIYYMAADPAAVDTAVISFLDGREGPQIDSRPGWDVLGIEFRAHISFACAILDYRAFVRNDGE